MPVKRYGQLGKLILDCPACQEGRFTFLEVGAWRVRRPRELWSMLRRRGKVLYFGFDLFDDYDKDSHAHEHCGKKPPHSIEKAAAILKEEVPELEAYLYRGDTGDSLPEFVRTELPGSEIPIDFIFIDGGHSVDTIRSDWANCSQLMHSGTRVVFDDFYLEREDVGCRAIISEIQDDERFQVQVLDVGDRLPKHTTHLVLVTRSPTQDAEEAVDHVTAPQPFELAGEPV